MGVFLSYSRHDEDVVKVLARGFDEARREVWFDHELTGGEMWWDTILRNIRSCSVFLLAMSDHSLQSRACTAELEYARALGRPILPVQVGPVTATRSNTLAGLQTILFRRDDAVSGFEVLGGVELAAREAGPLPDPLPTEPPIPFAYLQVIRRHVDRGELTHSAQLDIIDQLRRALGEETDVSVRREIVLILETIQAKPWLTRGALLEVRAVLYAHQAIEADAPGADDGDPGPAGVRQDDRGDAPVGGAGDAEPPRWAGVTDRGTVAARGLDPSTEFLERVDRIYRQMQGGRFWREGPEPGSQFGSRSGSQPDPPEPDPPASPAFFAGVTPARTATDRPPVTPSYWAASTAATTAAAATPDPPAAAPRNRWPSSVVALLAWAVAETVVALRLGAVALVLLVPGAVAVSAAVASHRVDALWRARRPDGARRASRAAAICGVVALVGVVVVAVALLVRAPTTP